MRTWHVHNVLLLAALILAVGEGSVLAQSRKRLQFSRAELTKPGEGLAHSFRSYSYGLGSLGARSSGPGSSVLRSSIDQAASYTLRSRSKAAAFPGSPALPEPPRAGISYKPLSDAFSDSALPKHAGRPPADSFASGAFGGAQLYLDTFALEGDTKLVQGDEPITSLVPKRPSKYTSYMAEGDKLFRQGRYVRAADRFKLANYAASDDAASLLCLAHAHFALRNYGIASLHLQRALRFEPELALAPLSPRGFYGKPSDYEDDLKRLEKDAGASARRPDLHLLVAYFRWFDGDADVAKKALGEADRRLDEKRRKAQLGKAVKKFQQGMEARSLLAAPGQPVASTQPSAKEPAKGERDVQAPP